MAVLADLAAPHRFLAAVADPVSAAGAQARVIPPVREEHAEQRDDFAAKQVEIDAIERRVDHLANHCRSELDRIPGVTARDLGAKRCGIVTLEVDGHEAVGLAKALGEQGFAVGTSSPASTRIDFERRGMGTLLRIAPHYYNTEDEISACTAALAALVR